MYSSFENHPSKPIGFVYSPLWKITVFGGRLFRGGRLFWQIRYTSTQKKDCGISQFSMIWKEREKKIIVFGVSECWIWIIFHSQFWVCRKKLLVAGPFTHGRIIHSFFHCRFYYYYSVLVYSDLSFFNRFIISKFYSSKIGAFFDFSEFLRSLINCFLMCYY